jgi:hypothetical protein
MAAVTATGAVQVHQQTDWVALAVFLVTVAGLMGGIAKWVISRIDHYTASLSGRLGKIDEHLGAQDVKIARIEGRLGPGRR